MRATTTRCVSLPQLPDSLHRLAKKQSRRPPDFLSGHAYKGGKWDHRGNFTQEADLIRGVCGAHGGYETAEERGVHIIGGGRGLRGGPGKRVDGVLPGRPRSFRYINADQWTTAAQDEGECRRTEQQGTESFIAKWIVAEPGLDYGIQYYART